MRRQLLRDSTVYLGGSMIVQLMGFIGLILLMQFLPIPVYGNKVSALHPLRGENFLQQ